MKTIRTACIIAGMALGPTMAHAAQGIDADTLNKIADEGYNRGHVVELAAHLTDRIGSRITNSPGMREAEKWSQGMFKSWGLTDVHAEPFLFGRGWSVEEAHSRMVTPRNLNLRSIPMAWSPGTKGALTAPVIVAPITHVRDLAEWKGKVKGKIVMLTLPEAQKDALTAPFKRLEEGEIGKLNTYRLPSYDPDDAQGFLKRTAQAKEIDRFFTAEGAVALVRMSMREDAMVHGQAAGPYKAGETVSMPTIEMAANDYRRLARLAKGGEVTLEINSKVKFDDRDLNAYNIIANIAGSDPKAGYVMAGAHMDSWGAGDGATDNAAGVSVVMEAARILSTLKVKPKRGIRFALWSGEEQGINGSNAYVAQHLATRPKPTDPALANLPMAAWNTYPVTTLPGFKDLVAYFNLDNGSGKVRGIYAEGNLAAVPVLRNWMAPFDSMGAGRVVAEKTGSTDHVPMARLGIPAFQFIQDPLDYFSKTHHTNLDTFDYLRPDDLRQAAVVMAAMLLNAADSDAPIPHNVLPTQPEKTDPFKYRDPARN
jgi:carboxypeptidase Q